VSQRGSLLGPDLYDRHLQSFFNRSRKESSRQRHDIVHLSRPLERSINLACVAYMREKLLHRQQPFRTCAQPHQYRGSPLEKVLEEITVQDMLDRAGVGRSTF
jgi:hypothetical protein